MKGIEESYLQVKNEVGEEIDPLETFIYNFNNNVQLLEYLVNRPRLQNLKIIDLRK